MDQELRLKISSIKDSSGVEAMEKELADLQLKLNELNADKKGNASAIRQLKADIITAKQLKKEAAAEEQANIRQTTEAHKRSFDLQKSHALAIAENNRRNATARVESEKQIQSAEKQRYDLAKRQEKELFDLQKSHALAIAENNRRDSKQFGISGNFRSGRDLTTGTDFSSAQRENNTIDKITKGGEFKDTLKDFRNMAIAAYGISMAFSVVKNAISSCIQEANKLQSAMLGLSSIATFKGIGTEATLEAVKNLKLVKDGLLTVGDASLAMKNLLLANFTLEQSIEIIKRFGDTAAFGRQAGLEFGYAITSATEGIKNGNSILVDNAGMTKNLSIILKEMGFAETDVMNVQSDVNVRTALYNGILKETAGQLGDAARYTQTYAGETAKLDAKVTTLKQNLGQGLQDGLRNTQKSLTDAADSGIDFGKAIGGLIALLINFVGAPLTNGIQGFAALGKIIGLMGEMAKKSQGGLSDLIMVWKELIKYKDQYYNQYIPPSQGTDEENIGIPHKVPSVKDNKPEQTVDQLVRSQENLHKKLEESSDRLKTIDKTKNKKEFEEEYKTQKFYQDALNELDGKKEKNRRGGSSTNKTDKYNANDELADFIAKTRTLIDLGKIEVKLKKELGTLKGISLSQAKDALDGIRESLKVDEMGYEKAHQFYSFYLDVLKESSANAERIKAAFNDTKKTIAQIAKILAQGADKNFFEKDGKPSIQFRPGDSNASKSPQEPDEASFKKALELLNTASQVESILKDTILFFTKNTKSALYEIVSGFYTVLSVVNSIVKLWETIQSVGKAFSMIGSLIGAIASGGASGAGGAIAMGSSRGGTSGMKMTAPNINLNQRPTVISNTYLVRSELKGTSMKLLLQRTDSAVNRRKI